MRKFIENLPGFEGNYTKDLVIIALNHFMTGRKMYFPKECMGTGVEITTQAGFKNAILLDPKIKITEEQIDKIIADFNKRDITPDKYRDLQIQLDKYHTIDFKKRMMEQAIKDHPIRYAIHHKRINAYIKNLEKEVE